MAGVLSTWLATSLWTTPVSARDNDDVLPSVRARTRHRELPRPPELPSDHQLEASGATVGRVEIVAENIFDINNAEENTALFRLANHLHIRTRERTIAAQLLFASGMLYSARTLQESERILRSTRYLYDARIRPVAYHDGQVDIEVRTRDVWTLNPGLSFGRSGGRNTSGFEIEELNLLGLGSELSLGRKSDVDRDSTLAKFRDRNFLGSWWDLYAQLSDNSDGQARELAIAHPFYSLDTRWAAGVSVADDDRIDSQYALGRIANAFRTRQKHATLYGGWSAGLADGWAHRWTAGLTYDANQFTATEAMGLAGQVPGDRKLIYPWIGYELLQDAYETARNRDQIEKTEDFHLGWRFSAQLGWAAPAFGSDRDAVVFKSELNKGMQPAPGHTVLFGTSVAGRLEDGNLANGIASVGSRYYLRQSPHRVFFATLQVDVTSALDAEKQLLLGGDSGLRGYPLRYQAGEGRWLFTAEQRWFSDWYPFRLFNVGGAAFVDIGRAWGDDVLGVPDRGVLKDVGFGLRLGNSRSALGNVLHIDVAFPLDRADSISGAQILIESKQSF